jgi:hypothetical protein
MGNENFYVDVHILTLPTAAAGYYWFTFSVALLASRPQDLLVATNYYIQLLTKNSEKRRMKHLR